MNGIKIIKKSNLFVDVFIGAKINEIAFFDYNHEKVIKGRQVNQVEKIC